LQFGWQQDLLGGINKITGEAVKFKREGDKTTQQLAAFSAIPYYAWSHRGPGQMEVWIASEESAVRPEPASTLASAATIEASTPLPSLSGINDLLTPTSSGDETNLFYHWWPKKNQKEWIIYHFKEPALVSSSSVYWFHDLPRGGCTIPKSWKLFYQKGTSWIPVKNKTNYPVLKDQFCKVIFEPETTSGLKIEVQLPEKFSTGIHEWTVE
jgi:uncharacterized protein